MATIYITFSALLTALNNLLIRRGIDSAASPIGDPFIAIRFFTASLFSILFLYLLHGSISLHPQMSLVGVFAGLALGLLQYSIGRALQYGPAALSFIFVSSVCVFPSIFMFFLFGEEFGHGYSLWDLIGSSLVLTGLFLMGKGQDMGNFVDFRKWMLWIGSAFGSGVLYNLILQWRVLLQDTSLPDSNLLPFRSETAEGDLFIAIMFFVAALCQIAVSPPLKSLSVNQFFSFALVGGGLYVLSTFFLIMGTEFAITSTEKALIFPLNTVLLIFLCNIWGKVLYKEKINWWANILCAIGIITAQLSSR